MTKLTYTAANGLDLLAHQMRHAKEAFNLTGRKAAMNHVRRRRKAVLKRWPLAPFLVTVLN